jgi:nicotinate-nucleotide--dimethylbenzimidazole phosphoribosyltransferase
MVHAINQQAAKAALAHQAQLTKPQGALGRLEDLACWFAARQGKTIPDALRPRIAVFAADHGVVAEGVSAFPSVVTGEMVKNFAAGGAAINVLARQCEAQLVIVDVGVAVDCSNIAGVIHRRVQAGTANICHEPAMSKQACLQAMKAGREQAQQAHADACNLLIAGDMGIGNTTASAAIICALTGLSPETVVGNGTGVDEEGRKRKVQAVKRAITRAGDATDDVLWQLGGLEIAAICGCYLEAAKLGIPVVVDGFIATAAALVAQQQQAKVVDWMLASHISQEQGHLAALQTLGLTPLIDFSLRLGEGSGAALVVPLLQSAIALHRDMASFEAAGVSGKGDE